MSRVTRLLTVLVAGSALILGYIVWDWYNFTTRTEIDPQRGIYGNDHLEVWIGINSWMPAGARTWACSTLLERQATAMGGAGALAPHTCQEGYDPNTVAMGFFDMIVMVNTDQSLGLASAATDAQKTEIAACIKADLAAALTPEQVEDAAQKKPSPDTMSLVTIKGAEIAATCRAKSGF